MIPRPLCLFALLLLTAVFLDRPALADPPVPIRVQIAPVQIAQAESELDYWNAIKDSKNAEDYQKYLDKYPNGNFADLAKLRINKYAATSGPAAAAPAAPAADPQEIEIAYWNSIKNSKDAADYKAYLEKYPNGDFADVAELRIEQLSPPPAASAEQPAAPAEQSAAPAAPEPATPALPSPEPASVQPPASPAPAEASSLVFEAKDSRVYAKNGGQVRAEPDAKSTLVSKLKTNTEVHATGLSADGKWWRVEVPGGAGGYMHASVVSQAPVTAAPKKKKAEPAFAAPNGADEDTCQLTSQVSPNDRVSACERLVTKAGEDDAAKLSALNNLAAALDAAQRRDEAIRKYEQAAVLAPRNAAIYFNIGMVRLEQRRFPEARAAFEKAALLDSQNPDVVFQRGMSYIGVGDFEKAKLEVKRALLTKDDAGYYEKLGEIELARGDLDSAKVALERGRKADPGRKSLTLAAVNYYVGDTNEAANQVASVINDPSAALWNALIKKARGDAAGATAALEAGRSAVGDAWPGPIFDALSGATSLTKARAVAKDRDDEVEFQQLCALNFFVGEWAYLSGDKDAARAALDAALQTRAYDRLEYAAAKARLANM